MERLINNYSPTDTESLFQFIYFSKDPYKHIKELKELISYGVFTRDILWGTQRLDEYRSSKEKRIKKALKTNPEIFIKKHPIIVCPLPISPNSDLNEID